MSNSKYAQGNPGLGCGAGCKCGGTCGGGLGDGGQEATGTNSDMVDQAKRFINNEIPLTYKLGALGLGLGVLWLSTRKGGKKGKSSLDKAFAMSKEAAS